MSEFVVFVAWRMTSVRWRRYVEWRTPSRWRTPSWSTRRTPYWLATKVSTSIVTFVSTARKRSLRRLCFHRCLSVQRGVSAPLHAGIHPLPDQKQTATPHPPRQTPSSQTPPGRHPPRQTPPCAVHDGIRSTSRWYASHWNAFLFLFCFFLKEKIGKS